MSKNNNGFLKSLADGLFNNNPILVQLLGTCPTLAVTTSVYNAIGMGLSATAVLVMSNLLISLLRKFIPKQVRIASYIVIISGFVTAIELLINAFLPDLATQLGVFIPLIVVNCIILARAEAFASKNGPVASMLDGFCMGIGFTFALTILGTIREILGTGKFFGMQVMPSSYVPLQMLVLPAGAFITLGCVIAAVNAIKAKTAEKKLEMEAE